MAPKMFGRHTAHDAARLAVFLLGRVPSPAAADATAIAGELDNDAGRELWSSRPFPLRPVLLPPTMCRPAAMIEFSGKLTLV